jgi:hypothetical protein
MCEKLSSLTENIYHQKTKEYFKEVICSYNNGNYRSAIVMLYTVVICDLYFKLIDLRDIHNDEKARKILDDLKVEKEEDPVSSDWEKKLIEKSFREAKLLENDVYTHIITLKQYRNLSAHPALNSLEILFTPNKELVQSLMINMLEGLLTKPPIFTKNVFRPFVEELERIKNEFPTEERLKTYIESKFLIHFNKELVEYIFKHLWKITFKNAGEKEVKNRDINYRTLLIIYQKYEDILFEFIKKESAHFSDFLDDNSDILTKLVDFLSKYPNVYPVLKDHSKEILKNRIKSKYKLIIKSYFLVDSVKEHLEIIDKEIHTFGYYSNQPYQHQYLLKNEDIKFLYLISEKHNAITEFYDLMISHYYHSGHFDTADHTFDLCIRPYYKEFNKQQFEVLLEKANNNPQCYGGKYGSRNKILLEKAKSLFGDGVEEKYSNLFK